MESAQGNHREVSLLYRGEFLEVFRDAHWEYVGRVGSHGAVMIIPVTADNELVLVEEYRYPLQTMTIGLPAGISGDEPGKENEKISQTAIRELEEETGYAVHSLEFLFTGPSSPGLTNEMISFYLAKDLEKVGEGGGVANENITVHTIPIKDVANWAMEQIKAGKCVDPRVFMALYFVSCQQG